MAACLAKRVLFKSAILHSRQRPVCISRCTSLRNFLSDAYTCNEAWQTRLEDPVFQKLKATNYAFELDRKLSTNQPVSAVDIDLFANGVTGANELEDLEDLVHRFRRTPATVHTMPSTHHAVVRAFLEHKDMDSLVRILNDRVNYGIFPDYYACNMMMDFFLKNKNFRDAAKIATFLMLQEDFAHPITCSLALHSCLMYLRNPELQLWDTEIENEPKEENDEEEVLVRVRFVEPPFFDNHFDLRDSKMLVGKTLAFIGKQYSDIVGNTCQLIGWTMFENWDRLEKYLNQLLAAKGKEAILKEGVEQIQKLFGEIADDDAKTKEAVTNRFAPLVEKLVASGCVGDGDLLELATAKVQEAINAHESKDIEHIQMLYSKWADDRNAELDKQILEYLKQEKIKEIIQKKKELTEKEERLFFFENIEKHRLNIPPEEEDQLVNEEGKISGSSLLDVPPEIEGKEGRYSAGIIEQHEPWWRWKEMKAPKKNEERKKKKF